MRDLVPFAPFMVPVLIVAIVLTHKTFMAWIKYRTDVQGEAPRRLELRLDELAQRLEKIERRMANVETIVLEKEKCHEFERTLAQAPR